MSSGEDRLASALEQALEPPWAVFRNAQLALTFGTAIRDVLVD